MSTSQKTSGLWKMNKGAFEESIKQFEVAVRENGGDPIKIFDRFRTDKQFTNRIARLALEPESDIKLISSSTDQQEYFERNFTDPYCHVCGSKRVPARAGEVFSTAFDSKTGERLVTMVCNNPQCPQGCERNGGHLFPSLDFWNTMKICTRCKVKITKG